MERRQAALITVLLLEACLAGCGSPKPQPGNFKRSPDPVPQSQQAQNNAVQAAAAGTPSQAQGQVASPTLVQPSSAPATAPTLPTADSINIEPADASWSLERKHEQTVARLKKISLAIHDYALKEGRFPAAPGQRHSWRIFILPYLGHQEQFAKFNLHEAWDSPANVAAAKDVPPEYQSPWRNDDLTCFLAPLGQNTVLASASGVEIARLNDKWSSIIELIMVDDEHAVPWSKPADFVLASTGDQPLGSLGRERSGLLLALADGQVRWLPATTQGTSIRSLLTIGGDEFASASALTQDASTALPFLRIAASFENKARPAANPELDKPLELDSTSPAASAGIASPKQDSGRAPLPDDEEREKARARLKLVFNDEITRTQKGDKLRSKYYLAVELLKEASKVEDDPAGHFVLLQTARDNAAAAGDFKLAQQATTSLIQRYQVNELELRQRTVTESAKAMFPHFAHQNDDLRNEAGQVLKLALAHDDFGVAKEVFAVYADATRRGQAQRHDLQRLQTIEKEIESFRRAYASVLPAIQTLSESPGDGGANYTVGAYLCLAKFRWIDGAKHLAKGSNLRLKVLATEDLSPPVGPAAMAELADEYWALSEQEAGLFKRGLQLRAVYWYRQALPDLTASLAKVQAERRIEDAIRTYGETLVTEALTIMDPAALPPMGKAAI